MKTKKILGTIALAFLAAFAAPVHGETLTGDIVDVRVLGTNDMEHSFTAGEKIYIRVRMLVENHDAVRGDESGALVAPLKWSFFETGTASTILNPPRLGLWIGDKPAYADYTYNGPEAWQKSEPLSTDDAGDATPPKNTKYRYFSDLYFVYTVKAGDMGFPIMLMNSSGTGPASMADDKHGYYIQNVTDAYPAWILKNSNGTEAKFWYGDIAMMEEDWPTGISGDHAFKNYDLSLSPAYVKTIDFDQYNADGLPYSAGDVWRNVYIGMSTPPGLTPRLVLGGGTSSSATIVYVWSADETVAYPVASGDNTISIVDGKKVLRVSLPAGETSVPFLLEGAAGASENAETTIFMSPVATGNVTKPAGELVHVAVSRTIKAIAAPSPTVRIYLDGDKTLTSVTADPDYQTYKVELSFKMAPVCTEDVTLKLSATVNGGSSLNALYNDNILRICESEDFDIDGKPLQVTIPANTAVVTRYIYILGATEDTESGIKFKHELPAGVTATGTCTMKVMRGGDENPIIVSNPNPTSGSEVTIQAGGSQRFTVKISDTYRSMKDTAVGYTVYIEDTSTDDYLGYLLEVPNVTPNSRGQLIVNATSVSKDWNGKSVVWYALSPDGITYTEEVPYTIKVTDSKQVLVSPVAEGVYTVGEGDDYAMALALNQALSGTTAKYIFLKGATTTDDGLFSSAQTVTGVSVGPNAPFTASTTVKLLDGRTGGTSVTINAYLGNTQDDPTDKTAGWSEGAISIMVTNKPPAFGSVTFDGVLLQVSDKGTTVDKPIPCGANKTFSISATDVAADLDATGADAFQVKWSIDGHEYTTSGNPNSQSVSHTFNDVKAGAVVYVWMKDKDMEWQSDPDFYFYVNVTDGPSVSVSPVSASLTVGEGDYYQLALELNQTFSGTASKYIFINGVTPADNALFTSSRTATGATVAPNRLAPTEETGVTFLDGGAVVSINAFLSDSQTDPTATTAGWGSGTIAVTVTNKPPVLQSVTFGGTYLQTSDKGTTLSVPVATSRTFSIGATDVEADLNATGTDAFQVKWNIDNHEYTTSGNPNSQSVNHTFSDVKDGAVVRVWMKDKDMSAFPTDPDFFFYVDVKEGPSVSVAPTVPNLYTVAEGESYQMQLALENTESMGNVAKYIFLVGATEEDKTLFTSSQTSTGVTVGPNKPFTATTSATMLDGKAGGTSVTIDAYVGDNRTDPTSKNTTWSIGEIAVTVTNVPPKFETMIFDGLTLGMDASGTTHGNAIYQGASRDFSLTISDVAADLGATDVEMVKMSIDGTYYYITNNPAGQTVSHEFKTVKAAAPVLVWLKDKDMSDYQTTPNFTYYIPVVARPGMTIATGATEGTYFETEANAANAYVTVTLDETAGDSLTVRLSVSQTTDGGYLRLRTLEGSVTNVLDGAGDPVPGKYDIIFPSGTRTRRVTINDMDGTDDTLGGLELNAEVVTDTQSGYGMKWSEFYNKAQSLTVYVKNVDPVLTSVMFGGRRAVSNETYTVPLGVPRTFSLNASDVLADLSSDEFDIKWNIGDREYVRHGHPTNAANTVTNVFDVIGLDDVEVRIKDKDMSDYPVEPNFAFKVNVVDKPYVSIETGGSGAFSEADAGGRDSWLRIVLSERPGTNATVHVKIAKANDGGFLKLNTDADYVTQTADTDTEMEYDVEFEGGTTQRTLYISEMDGTPLSRNGLAVNASVTNETVNSYGMPLKDFYVKAEQSMVYVENAEPVVIRPSDDEVAYTNENASANTPYIIYYGASDVASDTNIAVSIIVDGREYKTNVTDSAVYPYEVKFSSEGTPVHKVRVTFTDKDGGVSWREMVFLVKPAKNVELTASHGYGYVHAGLDLPEQVLNFTHYKSFGSLMPSFRMFATGYKADGSYDDGNLIPGPDQKIDGSGSWTQGVDIPVCYNYTTDTSCGREGKDSFPYAVHETTPKSSMDTTFLLKDTILDSSGRHAEMNLDLPESEKDAEAYATKSWVVEFSQEYMTTDNCGDINQDGIPDLFVFYYGMGIFENQQLVKTDGTADRTDVSKYNADKDKDGNDSPDFLPATEMSMYGALIPGLSGTWVTEGSEFDAKTELRGYHEGLNDALGNFNLHGISIESDRIYAVTNDVGEWMWTEDCTISELEFLAWKEYAFENGLDWSNSVHWTSWSPERPTSPILDDTDGDIFSDGYEYFFWYRAHVGYMDGTNHRRLTGRRYDPRNPGEGTLITSEDIARLMDPLDPGDSSVKTRDTDYDGLPDILEFMIGTNPFDFDTDGDGLPDGWELMIAGLNPLLSQTSAGALDDGMRNYDGDAMAITSYELETLETLEVPARPERCRFTTFAVIDPDGDTDGVQWYATTNTAEAVSNMVDFATTTPMWCFKLADGTQVATMTKPNVTEEGRLAGSFSRENAFTATKNASGDMERGWPLYLQAGTPVNASTIEDDPVDVAVLSITNMIDDLAASAAWVYGKGKTDATRGQVAKTAADYGCLALGRHKTVKENSVICAVPNEVRDVALLHYMVYQQCGFDPRTAWTSRDPIAARWGTLVDDEIVEGVGNSEMQHPARTRDYRTYDEFLVYSFFVNNGCDMTGLYSTRYEAAPYLARAWGMFTTNPQGPNEPDPIQLPVSSAAQSAVGWTQYFFGRDGSENGADTDGDGVPDGWELYVMSGPKQFGKFTLAPPYAGFRAKGASAEMEFSYFSPFLDYAQKTETLNKNYVGADGDDKLNEFHEFEGTDSIAHYADARGGDDPPYSTTIKHDGEWKWFNKFLPTDPWNKDTDGDGIDDKKESTSFAYGTPADDGKLKCIPGGGLNPCSVDTDADGLPDPWELQFKGKTQFPGDLPGQIAEMGNKVKDADGKEVGNYLQGLIDGMDGTVIDAKNFPFSYKDSASAKATVHVILNGVNQIVNRDYDNDGLDNWQEYITGTMRCWRYDDPISPWIPIPRSAYSRLGHPDIDVLEGWFATNAVVMPSIASRNPDGSLKPLLDGDTPAEKEDDFWYKTLVDKSSVLYNPRLVSDVSSGAQYFSKVTNVWDFAYGGYYWFYDRIGNQKVSEVWVNEQTVLGQHDPSKYASCSPIDADSDRDGMDDGYEMFHGMNPILGASGIFLSTEYPCDLVYDSWGDANNLPWYTAEENFWGSFYDYDFVSAPWLNGLADADPDGDGVPNQTEALMPKLAAPAMHTDPTPLWMTDATYDFSLVRRFFRMSTRFWYPLTSGHHVQDITDLDSVSFTHKLPDEQGGGTVTYWFRDFEGWAEQDFDGNTYEFFTGFVPDYWQVAVDGAANWMYSFEENEGYDSDHDGVADEDEKSGKVRGATDPQDADSPRRRQAMYFQGPSRPSALQTMSLVAENHPICTRGYVDEMAFRTFTVECWARPESLADSVLVERAVKIGHQNPGDEEFVRKNFQIAIKDGKWYAKFDPFSTRADDAVEVFSSTPATDDGWTHLAATYDGADLVLYVNGAASASRSSELLPAYGSEAVAVTPGQAYWFDIEFTYCAVIVGASAKTTVEGGNGYALDVSQGVGWDAYARFYKGWIDEVRIWDGARTAAEIAGSMNERFNAEKAAANRKEIADLWLAGRRRDAKETDGTAPLLPAELRYHWSFDSIFGAQNESALAKAPGGFNADRALVSRPDNYEIAWWKTIHKGLPPDTTSGALFPDGTAGYAGSAYNDMAWVPWIPNTVAHLPRFDSTTLDSMFWSGDHMGGAAVSNYFANSAEPVTFWTQMSYNGATSSALYGAPGSRHYLVNIESYVNDSDLYALYEFTGRHLTQTGEDLIPLGGAYARYCDNTVGMWDGQGASSSWELTGEDSDNDGLADWWETYADENYRSGLDPSVEIGWNTTIVRGGISMIAGEAYLRDLAAGFYMNADGEAVTDSTLYEQIADGSFSGSPDWWEDMYGIAGESGLADHDGDGLPNYIEYLLSEVFKFEGVMFDPTDPNSVDPFTPDYFYRVGELYVGEIFTDHDLVDDVWEDSFPTLTDGETKCASRYAYDPASDADGDGWSNLAECRAGTEPNVAATLSLVSSATGDDNVLPRRPEPIVRLSVTYGSRDAVSAGLILKAWKGSTPAGIPDAVWKVNGADSATMDNTRFIGYNPNRTVNLSLGPGAVAQGSFKIQFFDPTYVTETVSYGTNHNEVLARNFTFHSVDNSEWMSPLGFVDTPPADVTSSVGTFPGGTLNYANGEVTIDFTQWQDPDYVTGEETEKTATMNHYKLDKSYVRLSWKSRMIGSGLRRQISFSTPSSDTKSLGGLREGLNTFVAFADLNGNGEYDPATEPYGIARNVDVRWNGVSVDIELTDISPTTQRFDLWNAGAMQVAVTNIGETSDIPEGDLRIRVVRWRVDDVPLCAMNLDDDSVPQTVVLDKIMNSNSSRTFTEADVLDDDTFDLDWGSFYDEVVTNELRYIFFGSLVKAEYLVQLGYSPYTSWNSKNDTNKWVLASQQILTRYYGPERVIPVPVLPDDIPPTATGIGMVNTANPTFTWKLDCPEREGYTAFRIVVTNEAGFKYDSGIRRAPPRAADKTYRWTAPLYVDDKTTDGMVFSNKTVYGWKVAMYNSKFRTDEFSTNTASFLMDVQTNATSSGTAPVRVRYFGPATNFTDKVVRVQAFRAPDFAGLPVAAGYVHDDYLKDLAATGIVFTATNANCRVAGMPEGSYYLRAFIDSNTNGVCDAWESSGYFTKGYGVASGLLEPAPVSVSSERGMSDVAVIYIEDADTDNDGLPDAWEYEVCGNLDEKGVELLSETPAGEIYVNTNLVGNLEVRAHANTVSSGLAVHTRSVLRNAGVLALALGASTAGYDTFAAAISGSVSTKLAEDGVKIAALDLVDGKVYITVETEAETGNGLVGPLVPNVNVVGTGLDVMCKVYWKQSLEDAEWQCIKTETITVGAGPAEIELNPLTDATSGFYRVEVSELPTP